MITREALRILSNNLTFAMNVNRNYDDQFGRHGAMIGQTVNIRKPAKYLTTVGPVVNIQAQNETYVPLVLNNQWQVSLSFTSAEMSLSIDDFSERVIKPAIVNLANTVDAYGFAQLNSIYNATGTPGVALSNNKTFLDAGTVLDLNLAPRDDMRTMLVDPATQAFAVYNGTTLFNPAAVISDQYIAGQMGDAYGFNWFMDQQIPTHTVGTYGGSPIVNGLNQTGSSLITNGWTATTTSLNVGDIFTIGNVFRVNDQSKAAQTQLQQFVVTAQTVTDSSGNSTISISPPIQDATFGAQQNVSVAATTNDVITVLGASGVTSQQSVAFHRDAFVLGIAPLVVPPAGVVQAGVETDPQTGLSIRMIMSYDIRSDQFITRFDILGGWAILYPQLATRIFTS